MRSGIVIAAAFCSVVALTARAEAASQGGQAGQQNGPPVANAAQNCPPGSRWIPEGYERHGKYRPGHCSVKR